MTIVDASLSISEAATRTGLSTHTLRYYERAGLMLGTEYSLWSRHPEAELLPVLRELGIGFVPYSPFGRGFLTGAFRSSSDIDDADFRKISPRLEGENFDANLRIVEHVTSVATEAGITPAQVALGWRLAQGDDIAPIPGTKRVDRLEENSAADDVVLTTAQIENLGTMVAPSGDRYSDMSSVNR